MRNSIRTWAAAIVLARRTARLIDRTVYIHGDRPWRAFGPSVRGPYRIDLDSRGSPRLCVRPNGEAF